MASSLIATANKHHYNELIELWEASVRATHHFLSDADIRHYKLLIYDYYFDQLAIYYVREPSGICGFIGLKDNYIQMLFVHPDFIGKGWGKQLLLFAIEEKGATKVDVNEQNTQAVGFYERIGFETTDRAEMDASGKPFPVLSMELK